MAEGPDHVIHDDDIPLQRNRFYLGRAKVDLRHIRFEDESVPGGRLVDDKKVVRLLNVFEKEKCLRFEPDHDIPALIDPTVFESNLERSGLDAAAPLDLHQHPHQLKFSENDSVLALQGKHRTAAARKFLLPFDRWWTVELYSTELPEACVLELRTKDPHARRFTDADLFRHLRHYQRCNDLKQAKKWEARLSERKLQDVNTMLSKHEPLKAAFDDLLPFPAILAPLQLGTFHRTLAMNCEEVCLKSFEHLEMATLIPKSRRKSITWCIFSARGNACLVVYRPSFWTAKP